MALDRRGFFQALGATGLLAATEDPAAASPLTEQEKLAKIASNTWPIRHAIFKGWPNVLPNADGKVSVALVNSPLAVAMRKNIWGDHDAGFPSVHERRPFSRRHSHGSVLRPFRRHG